MSDVDILITATDQASATLEQVGETGSDAADTLDISWGKVAVAIGAAAATVEAANRSIQGVRTNIYQMAVRLGESRGEINSLTRDIADFSMNMQDASDVMTTGIREGLKSKAGIKEYAEYWKMVSEATGENAEDLATAAQALKALDIHANNVTDSLSTFDFLLLNTDYDLLEFLATIGKSAKELSAAKISIEDTAIALAVLDNRGGTAKTQTLEFRKALDQANGSRETFFTNLRIDNETLETYQRKVKDAAGTTGELSEANRETYTGIQKISANLKEGMVKYEGFSMGFTKVVETMFGISLVIPVIGSVKSAILAIGHVATIAAAKVEALQLGLTTLGATGVIAVAIAVMVGFTYVVGKLMDKIMEKAGFYELADEIMVQKGGVPKRKPGESANDYARRLHKLGPRGGGAGGAPTSSLVHSGTVTVKGINDKDQLVAVANIAVEEVIKQMRTGNRSLAGGWT